VVFLNKTGSNIMKHKTSQSGFTLIELIAVMVILGILAAVLIPRMSSVTESAYGVNAKQMYSAIESHLYLQAQQSAITGSHGVETFPTVATVTKNAYIDDWIKDYDSEHWTQLQLTGAEASTPAIDGTTQDMIYFIYHPHEAWAAGADPANGSFGTSNLTILKDVYYISYYPLTNAEGEADGITNNEFHLALHKDDKDNVAQFTGDNMPATEFVYHCGGDDKDSDGDADTGEVTDTPCGWH
jgi:prepilin-type N-terminal cleavage/methylation domain-containing protein